MKKILTVIISVAMALGSILPCLAAAEKCTCGESPVIYVAALGSSQVVRDAGTENETVLFRPETERALKIFAPAVPAAAQLLIDGDYNKFGDVLIGCVNELFGDLAFDGDGNSKLNVAAADRHPDSAEHGTDRSYYFGYDFRLDPVDIARKLHTYIEEVKKLTHHDTVRFKASSMGGVVVMSYLRLYGSNDIETIILQCCPLQGTAVAGELFNGKVEINKYALLNYARCALPSLDSDFLGGLLYMLIDIFEAVGIWDSLLDVADELILNLQGRVYDECLIPIFGTLPGIWSFVPDKYYESGKEYMQLNNAEMSGLVAKLDFYHYEVQGKLESLLNSAKNSGTQIYIVAGYNMQRTPLVTAYKSTSDGTVDTCFATCGATCAPIGETLAESYTQARFTEKNYISPDRKIDASTCILPECTWFIKDMLHSTTHDGHKEFYRILLDSETQLTVFDMEEYSQFLQNDTVNQSFRPVTAEKNELSDAFEMLKQSTSFLNFVKLMTAVINFCKTIIFEEILNVAP